MNNKSPIYHVVLQLCRSHPERDLLLNDAGEPNQNELHRRTGINQPTLQRIFSGESKDPRDSTIEPLAKLFGVSLLQLKGKEPVGQELNENATMARPDSIDVPVMNAEGSMGAGRLVPEHDAIIDYMRLSLAFLRRRFTITSPSNLRVVIGYGDSMAPTIKDGDPVVVDTGVTELKIDGIYVLSRGDELFIKRMQRLVGGGFEMISDNQLYKPQVIMDLAADNLVVRGRALIAWNSRDL